MTYQLPLTTEQRKALETLSWNHEMVNRTREALRAGRIKEARKHLSETDQPV